ncbi:MAG: transposase [Gammaproteobacteria bacterium]|nr:transposase [Gammaproteobacteria bacterium]
MNARGSNVVALPSLPGPMRRRLEQRAEPTPFEALPEPVRARALARRTLVQWLQAQPGTVSAAAGELPGAVSRNSVPEAVAVAAALLARRGGACPARSRLLCWVADYARAGVAGLVDAYAGRPRRMWGWEARALHYYQRPNKLAYSTVAHWLREEGFDTATEARVRAYLQSLPRNATTYAPARVGAHYHRQNIRPYVVRDASVLPVGLVYEGDGHTCDVYVRHPVSGGHYRPELTAWIDVRSRFIVGWWLSDTESATTALFSLSHALVAHDHVPAFVHTDPGSGFVNKVMTADVTGYCARLSIEHIAALPGNAKGKGLIERWFGIFEERLGKRFESYCGGARTDDALQRLATRIKRGEIELPTFRQYADEITAFVAAWNAAAQRNLGTSPAGLWATLERVSLETPAALLIRPVTERVARRCGLALDNRLYRDPALAAWEGATVQVEYDLHDDTTVTVRDAQGRWVCEARLVEKKPWLAQSRIADGERKRLEGRTERLRAQLEEMERRAALIVGQERDLRFLDVAPAAALTKTGGSVEPPAVQPVFPGSPTGIEFDLDDTDYL